VGLSYTGTLARSAGFVTATLVAIVGAVSLVREARREDAEGKTRRERWFPPVGCTVVIACGMVLYLGLILPPVGAWMAGNAVMAGRPVSPTVAADPVLPLPILAIHADPEAGGGPSHQDLRAVADIYQLAYLTGASPTKTVMERFGLPRSTASRWIRLAREHGLLGPATPRKAGG
jgi:hypothetical protein